MVLASPEPITLTTTQPGPLLQDLETILFTQCTPQWSNAVDGIYIGVKSVFLFFAPVCFIIATYVRVIRRLSRLFTKELSKNMSGSRQRLYSLERRRATTRLLIALSVIYLVSYCPVYLLGALKNFITITDQEVRVCIGLVVHWMCYVNAAVNPVIYCLLSNQFREEWVRILGKCWCKKVVETGSALDSRTPQLNSGIRRNLEENLRRICIPDLVSSTAASSRTMSLTPSLDNTTRMAAPDEMFVVSLPDPKKEPALDFFFGLNPVSEDDDDDDSEGELCMEDIEVRRNPGVAAAVAVPQIRLVRRFQSMPSILPTTNSKPAIVLSIVNLKKESGTQKLDRSLLLD